MSDQSSWIKLNRGILDWRWYNDPNTFRVFIHLLLTANIRDGEFKSVAVKRGQVVVSAARLGENLMLSRQKVRSALAHLKSTNEITITRHSNFELITIVNYNKYQDLCENVNENEEVENDSNHVANHHLTIIQPSFNHNQRMEEVIDSGSNLNISDYLKKDRKETNVKKRTKENLTECGDFDVFWAEYPRKVAKSEARKSFERKTDGVPMETIMTALRTQKKQWDLNDKKFIPYPTTWLNQKRWEDEAETETAAEKQNESSVESKKIVTYKGQQMTIDRANAILDYKDLKYVDGIAYAPWEAERISSNAN